MVNKLIGGFLRKKPEAASSESVPDELPPLGESAQPAAPAGPPAGNTPEEPPDELPSLDEKKPEPVEVRPSPHREEQIRYASESDEVAKVDMAESADEAAAAEPDIEKAGDGAPDGFFAGLSKLLKGGRPIDSLISHDLLANMKESWGIRKESSMTGLSSSEEKRIGIAISEVLAQLKLLEGKWRSHKVIIDEYEKMLKEQEDKIKGKEKELKYLLRAYKLYQVVPEGSEVMIKDSIAVQSLSDVINTLRTIDVATFKRHVNKDRNDFSKLAGIIDGPLGEDLRKTHSKNEMLRVLEKYAKSLS